MCGFLFFRSLQYIDPCRLDSAAEKIRARGPDRKCSISHISADGANLYFSHYLLDVSGTSCIQPYEVLSAEGELLFTLLFNGEIYNYAELSPDSASDTLALASLLSEMGEIPFSKLDGEYAIFIYDHSENSVLVATDQFMTKPLAIGWSSSRDAFGAASYPSALQELGLNEVHYATPNSVLRISLDSLHNLIEPATKPSLDSSTYVYYLRQDCETYDAWESAFINAVRKRAMHGGLPVFVPLSSGYDSGAICLALNLLGAEYHTITIDSQENNEILDMRIHLNGMGSCSSSIVLPALTATESEHIRQIVEAKCEPLDYFHEERSLQTDDGSIGALRVAEVARQNGWMVCISGGGADEIISDYGHAGHKFYPHSEFGGFFPEMLEDFFPWRKFYEDSMRSYIFKDEFIFGVLGIEGRYPFLDISLTQSFLALTSDLKNMEYKAPLAHFLRKHNYPFEPGVKRGFCPKLSTNTPTSADPVRMRQRMLNRLKYYYQRIK